METITFLSGVVAAQLGDEWHRIEAESTLFIPPKVIHQIRNIGEEPVRLFAFLASGTPEVIYPEPPEPVEWHESDV